MNKYNKLFGFREKFRKEDCLIRLEDKLPTLLGMVDEALKRYYVETASKSPRSMSWHYRAEVVRQHMRELVLEKYDEHLHDTRNGRSALLVNGCLIFFNQFDENGMPKNDKTSSVTQSIENQEQGSFFTAEEMRMAPCLFLGYTKDPFGNFVNPQLAYIENGHRVWEFTMEDFKEKPIFVQEILSGETNVPHVKLKNGVSVQKTGTEN